MEPMVAHRDVPLTVAPALAAGLVIRGVARFVHVPAIVLLATASQSVRRC